MLRKLAAAALVAAAARDPTRAECFLGDLCGPGADRDWSCLQHVPPTCSRLNLAANGIDNAGAAALAEALRHNTAVKTVKLGHNVIGDAGATALAASLALSNSSVSTLCVPNPRARPQMMRAHGHHPPQVLVGQFDQQRRRRRARGHAKAQRRPHHALPRRQPRR